MSELSLGRRSGTFLAERLWTFRRGGGLAFRMQGTRFDIQFMRGVAVLAVVVFHAFPDAFPHGFLGVDVFFVVSGFLITGIILKGVGQPGFFGAFYKRRALRLLPASLVTLTVTSALAVIFLTNSQRADYAEQLLGSLAFAANFVLAGQTGYFEGAAETKPLLHIWSLSLEEQFYFVAPFLLWITPARYRLGLLVTGLVLSLALCLVVMTGPSWLPFSSKGAQKLAFFMLPARAWELLAGSVCAWLMLNRPTLAIPAWVKYLALAIIPVICIVGLDPVHPRWDAAIVVLATSVLLLGKDGWLPNVGLTRPIWHVGNWSYSLYLTHWPLFSFAFITYGGAPPSPILVGLAGLAVVLAFLQWRYVENTCRNGLPFKLGALPSLGGASITLAVFAGVWVGATSHTAEQLQPTHGLASVCDEGGSEWVDRPECRTSDAPTMALWGDSYAMHLIPGLDGVPLVQMTKSACAPTEGVAHVSPRYTSAWARECVGFNESVLTAIAAMPSVRVVVISSTFAQVLVEDDQSLLVDGRVVPFSGAGQTALVRAVLRLKMAGKAVIIVGPTPRANFDAGRCNERMIEGRPLLGRTGCDIDRTDPENAAVRAALLDAGRASGVSPLFPAAILCGLERCITRSGTAILYRDNGHLTAAGSKTVVAGLGLDRAALRSANSLSGAAR